MEPAPFAPDETGRLLAVHDLAILDTPAERRFDRITQLAARLTNADIGIVSFVDETRIFFKSVCGAAWAGKMLGQPHREYWFCSHVVAHGLPVVVDDARADPRFDRAPAVLASPGVAAYAGVPLRAPTGPHVGALAVLSVEPRRFSEAEVNVLSELARLLEAELSSLPHSTIDALTGALNSRTFTRLGNRFLELADSRGLPVSLLRLDVRGTGEINSRFGYEVGDLALRETAQLLGSTVRASDLIGRVGPDEFAMLLLGSDVDAARSAAERLRTAAGEHNARTDRTPAYELAFDIDLLQASPGAGGNIESQLAAARGGSGTRVSPWA